MNDATGRRAERGADLFAGLTFTGHPLDRLSEKREDAALFAALAARADARAVVIARDALALAAEEAFLPLAAVGDLPSVETVLLGVRADGAPVFAVQLADACVAAVGEKDATVSYDTRRIAIQGRDDLTVRDLRSLAVDGIFAAPDTAVLAQAKAILGWHARHRFCSNCGAPTRMAASGWRRECDACKAQHFPRTDPVVIMLAVDGEHCLLGRQARFPKHMFSALAGFVESGETIEEAARREIFEEAGVRCGSVAYLGSQPWPFPMTLMIGCLARAQTRDLVIDRSELEEARWFSRDEVLAMGAGRHQDGLTIPHPLAIGHHIISAWAEGRASV